MYTNLFWFWKVWTQPQVTGPYWSQGLKLRKNTENQKNAVKFLNQKISSWNFHWKLIGTRLIYYQKFFRFGLPRGEKLNIQISIITIFVTGFLKYICLDFFHVRGKSCPNMSTFRMWKNWFAQMNFKGRRGLFLRPYFFIRF